MSDFDTYLASHAMTERDEELVRAVVDEVMLPLLLLPMLVPVLIAAAKLTQIAASGDVMGDTASWFRMLAAFDLIFFTASIAVFDSVIGG